MDIGSGDALSRIYVPRMTSDTDSFGCHGVQRIPLTSLCPPALTAPLQLADAMGPTPVSNPAVCLRAAFWASRTTDAPSPGPGALSAGGSPILGAKTGSRSAKKSLGKVCRSGQADMCARCNPDPSGSLRIPAAQPTQQGQVLNTFPGPNPRRHRASGSAAGGPGIWSAGGFTDIMAARRSPWRRHRCPLPESARRPANGARPGLPPVSHGFADGTSQTG